MSYSKFGASNPISYDQVFPYWACIDNTWFNKQGLPGSRMQEDFCPRFMADHCSKDWTPECDAYLISSKVDSAGNTMINKGFLAEVAKRKYCRPDYEAPGSQCSLRCESFNPQDQTSVSVCAPVGAQNWLNTNDEKDLTGDFPQSARLMPVSPLYLGKCPWTCDAKAMPAGGLTKDDPVLNKCIEHAACDSVLADLSYNVVKNNIPVSNPAFQRIIEASKNDTPINVNSAQKLAQDLGIPAEVSVEVMKNARYDIDQKAGLHPRAEQFQKLVEPLAGDAFVSAWGTSSTNPTKTTSQLVSGPSSPGPLPIIDTGTRAIKEGIVVSPTGKEGKEGFYPRMLTMRNVLENALRILVIVLIVWLIYRVFFRSNV